MASKRELVEAHAFNHRRLVTAFTSGMPEGRELEPRRPVRAVVAGAVLAGLVMAGVAVYGYLRPGLPDDWDENRLIVAEDSGSRYVTTGDGVLRPVLNIASARLVLAPADGSIVSVPDAELEDLPRGATIGIPGAPDSLPDAERLVTTGWSSCLGRDEDVQVRLGGASAARSVETARAAVVTADSATWVLWAGRRFPLEDDTAAQVLLALRLDQTPPRAVPPRWLNLFPVGPALRPFPVPGAGDPVPGGTSAPAGATLGTVVEVTAVDGSVTRYVQSSQGLVPMSDVALAIYGVATVAPPLQIAQGELAGSTAVPASTLYPSQWPAELPRPWPDDVVCVVLESGVDQVPGVALARPADTSAPQGPVAPVVVEPGAGALVRAVNGSVINRGTVYLVDGVGQRYALGGGAAERLGYADVVPVPVPLPWVESFTEGPELSGAAAARVMGGT
ncbi:MAG: type VII secretion protein EccB [Kineosporiaceae bacterium]